MNISLLLNELSDKFGYEFVQEISMGNSSSFKFIASKNNKKFFIRVKNYDCSAKMTEAINIFKCVGINTPELVDFGSLMNDNLFFDVYTFIEGLNLKEYIYDNFSLDLVNVYGYNCGCFAKLLKEYNDVNTSIFKPKAIDYKSDELNKLIKKLFLKNCFDINDEIFNNLILDLEEGTEMYEKSFSIDSVNLIHHDMKPNNFILNDNKLYIVDLENIELSYNVFDFEFYLYWMFDKFDLKKTWVKAYFNALFDFNIPDYINGQLKYAFISGFLKTLDYNLSFGKNLVPVYINACYNHIFKTGIDNFFDRILD